MELLLISVASALAGFVDAIVGGGGLILMPALFAAYPGAPAATLIGTNKSASVWGSALACWQYGRRVSFRWELLVPCALVCLFGAALGAGLLLYVSNQFLRRALPFVLLIVLIYTLLNKNLGQSHQPRYQGWREGGVMCLITFVIGFYDGFFGPGTGSFFIFLFVRVLGYDFLAASAYAKFFNTASNVAAVSLLAFKGHVWWHISAYLLCANLVGSYYGARLAMKHGAPFVRFIFIFVVLALILKTFWDAYMKW